MKRLVVLALVVFGLVLGSAPAYAEVTISIKAGKSTLMVGTSTTISGAANRAKPGSVVDLQRKIDGTWTTIKSKKVWAEHTYKFSVTPPKGYQYYRVIKKRQFGQPWASSPTLKLTVRWSPTLTASAEYDASYNPVQTIRLIGKITKGPSSPQVAFERKDDEGWTTLETRTVTSGTEFTFEHTAYVGPTYRLRLLSTTLTTQQVSPGFEHTFAPYVMELNSGLIIDASGPRSGTVAGLDIDIAKGEYVSLAASAGGADYMVWISGPSGAYITGVYKSVTSSKNIARFTATEDGTYRINVDGLAPAANRLELYVSTPKVVTTSLDAPTNTLSSDFLGQPVDVRFDTTEVDQFTVPNSGHSAQTRTVLDPSGTAVRPWVNGFTVKDPIYRTDGGVFTFRMEPETMVRDSWVQPLSVTTIQGVVDGPLVDTPIEVPRQVALVAFERPEEHVTVGAPNGNTPQVLDASTGLAAPRTGTGSSLAVVTGPVGSVPIQLTTATSVNATIDGPAVEVDVAPSYRREVAVHFSAKAGDVIVPEVTNGDNWEVWGSVTGLDGPDGNRFGTLDYGPDAWIVPMDGEYAVTVDVHGDWQGRISIKSGETITIPADGTPTTVTIDEPGEVMMARIPMPTGTTAFDATLEEVSASLGDTWRVRLTTPDYKFLYPPWRLTGHIPGGSLANPSSEIVAAITAENLGSLQLTFAPMP